MGSVRSCVAATFLGLLPRGREPRMQHVHRTTLALLMTLVLSAAPLASASAQTERGDRHDDFERAVFVQSNAPGGNQILVYRRANNGTLQPAGSFDTGGRGGRV